MELNVTELLSQNGDFMIEALAVIPLVLAAVFLITFVRFLTGQWLRRNS